MKEANPQRTQLDNGYQIPIVLFFLILPAIFIIQIIHRLDKMYGENYLIDGIFILIYVVIAIRLRNIKKVSFDNDNFYVKSLFKNDEISIPISRVTSIKKAFINLNNTDMFLIRYSNYDSKESLVKFIRHRNHISILQFRELIKKSNKNVDGLRGIVDNKF